MKAALNRLLLAAGAALAGAGLLEAGPPLPTFRNVTEEAGLSGFRYVNGASGRHYTVEVNGSGIAAFDYDGDGWVDIYAVNGAPLPGYRHEGPPPANALYRNNGDATFTDVTAAAGVGDTGYGMGCAAGDYDNDGFVDLYVTNWGANVLYHNNGDGTFTDVSVQAGVADPAWGHGCAFGDYDGDGDLDLYVTNWVVYALGDEEKATVP